MCPDTEIPKFDLSKLKKLKSSMFVLGQQDVKKLQWVTATLQTAESENLQEIGIHLYFDPVSPVEGTLVEEWRVLESLLIQLLTSRSIRPRITFKYEKGGNAKEVVRGFVPQLWAREEQFVRMAYW